MNLDNIMFLLPSKLAFVCMLLSVLVPVFLGKMHSVLKKWADPHYTDPSKER